MKSDTSPKTGADKARNSQLFPMPDYADVYMRFLPSEHGSGFIATIRADLGLYNWQQWYGHLKGKAERAPYRSKWAAIVEERLEKQGVRFV